MGLCGGGVFAFDLDEVNSWPIQIFLNDLSIPIVFYR